MLKKGTMQDYFDGYTFEDYESTAENTRIYWFFSRSLIVIEFNIIYKYIIVQLNVHFPSPQMQNLYLLQVNRVLLEYLFSNTLYIRYH